MSDKKHSDGLQSEHRFGGHVPAGRISDDDVPFGPAPGAESEHPEASEGCNSINTVEELLDGDSET